MKDKNEEKLKELRFLFLFLFLASFFVVGCTYESQEKKDQPRYLNEIGTMGEINDGNIAYNIIDEGFGLISIGVRAEIFDSFVEKASAFFLVTQHGMFEFELKEFDNFRKIYIIHIPNSDGKVSIDQIKDAKLRIEDEKEVKETNRLFRASSGFDRVIWQNTGEINYLALSASDYATAKLLGLFKPGYVMYIRTETDLFFEIAHFLISRDNNNGDIANTIEDLVAVYPAQTLSNVVNYTVENGELIEECSENIVTISVNPEAAGSVSFDNINWYMEVSQTFQQNDQVNVFLKVADDYLFEGWFENSILQSESNPYSFRINKNRVLQARFSAIVNEVPFLEKVSGVSGTVSENEATFQWFGTDSDGTIDHYKYKKDLGTWQTTNDYQYTWSDYSQGSHTFYVKAVDNDGLESETISWAFNYLPVDIPEGVFKVANSWGVGKWENVPDGYYYITYESFLQNVDYVYIAEKSFTPTRAVAVFEVDHSVRTDCNISFGVGDPESPDREINFSGHDESFWYLSGAHPYPNNVMVMDITPLLPLSNETVFFKIYDKNNTSNTGIVQSFKIEVYSSYDSNKISDYWATDVPLNTINGATVISQIRNLTISLSEKREHLSTLMASSIDIDSRKFNELKGKIGIADESKNYNQIVNGYGTGYRPPTAKEWDLMEEKDLLKEIKDFDIQARPLQMDHSASPFFPPIGNQGSKGSCSSWATAYYTGTFYNAIRYNRDLSDAYWIENYIGGYDYGEPDSLHQAYIMSPDFVYLQLNGGGDNGTSIFDNMHLMHLIGNASWKAWPYSLTNFTQWPDEDAWREAPMYRLNWKSDWVLHGLDYYPWFYLEINSFDDIDTLKNLLAAGYLASISVDSNQYENFTEDDIWNTENYDSSGGTGHANTVIGYFE